MAEKDTLVDQPMQLVDNYKLRGKDFPAKSSTKAGESSGKDVLVPQGGNQECARHVEDSGPGESGAGTPTEWTSGGRSKTVASNFPISTNSGEGDSSPSKVSIPESLDLASGKIGGGSAPKVGGAFDSKLTIGR